jgi:hypothetical protein
MRREWQGRRMQEQDTPGRDAIKPPQLMQLSYRLGSSILLGADGKSPFFSHSKWRRLMCLDVSVCVVENHSPTPRDRVNLAGLWKANVGRKKEQAARGSGWNAVTVVLLRLYYM